jgi:hypothetical protein
MGSRCRPGGGFGEHFRGFLVHLDQDVKRGEADVEVAAGEDHQEGDARPAGLVRTGEDAALVPEADPQARGHVAAEGDLEDGEDEPAEGEDVGLARAMSIDAVHAVLGGADEFAGLFLDRAPDGFEHGFGVVDADPDARAISTGMRGRPPRLLAEQLGGPNEERAGRAGREDEERG